MILYHIHLIFLKLKRDLVWSEYEKNELSPTAMAVVTRRNVISPTHLSEALRLTETYFRMSIFRVAVNFPAVSV